MNREPGRSTVHDHKESDRTERQHTAHSESYITVHIMHFIFWLQLGPSFAYQMDGITPKKISFLWIEAGHIVVLNIGGMMRLNHILPLNYREKYFSHLLISIEHQKLPSLHIS